MTDHSAGRRFFIPLESARGIAALIVAAFHVSLTPLRVAPNFHDAIIDPNIEHGIWYAAAYVFRLMTEGTGLTVSPPVLFFYILSGFVLTASLQGKSALGVSPSASFVVSRLFRILPATFFAVGMFALLYLCTGLHLGPKESYAPMALLKNASLLDVSIDGVAWTLQTEMIGSVLILITALLYRRLGLRIVVGICLILTLLSFWAPWNTALMLSGIPTRIGFIYTFVVGALVFHAGGRIVDALPRAWIAPLTVIALALFFCATKLTNGPAPLTVLIETIAAAFIVSALAFAPGLFASNLMSKPLPRFYGRISFSFYLLHPLTLAMIWFIPNQLGDLVDLGIPRPLLALGLTLATVLVATPLAYVSYRVAERQGIAAGRSCVSMIVESFGKLRPSTGVPATSSPRLSIGFFSQALHSRDITP
jgi:peptidoglycan/LPS O-acetylase OafA/YrhL